MELDRETRSNVSLVTEIEVLNYVCPAGAPREVIARVDLGSVAHPLAGAGGPYHVRAYINGATVSPDASVILQAGQTKATIIGRVLPLDAGDVLSIQVTGLAGDTGVDTVTSLRNATPIQASDAGGDGTVLVTSDYGGANNLSYRTSGNLPIDNASIRAFLAADYAAGHISSAYLKGQTTTKNDGTWVRPLYLDPGSYTLVFVKQGYYGPDTRAVTVS
jgi:hypothetical protein